MRHQPGLKREVERPSRYNSSNKHRYYIGWYLLSNMAPLSHPMRLSIGQTGEILCSDTFTVYHLFFWFLETLEEWTLTLFYHLGLSLRDASHLQNLHTKSPSAPLRAQQDLFHHGNVPTATRQTARHRLKTALCQRSRRFQPTQLPSPSELLPQGADYRSDIRPIRAVGN